MIRDNWARWGWGRRSGVGWYIYCRIGKRGEGVVQKGRRQSRRGSRDRKRVRKEEDESNSGEGGGQKSH